MDTERAAADDNSRESVALTREEELRQRIDAKREIARRSKQIAEPTYAITAVFIIGTVVMALMVALMYLALA